DGPQAAQRLEYPAEGLKSGRARQLNVIGIGHEVVGAAPLVSVIVLEAGEALRIVAERLELVLPALPQRDVVVTAIGRHAHEWLAHAAGDNVELARNVGADLAVSRKPVGGCQCIVLGKVNSELA